MSIGEKIKSNRKKKGLTQKQLGDKIEISEITIRRYEKGERVPTVDILGKLAAALGISVSELIGEDFEPVVKEFAEAMAKKEVDIIIPVIQYINENYSSVKYDLSQILDGKAVMDISSLIKDIVINRLRHYENINSNDDK